METISYLDICGMVVEYLLFEIKSDIIIRVIIFIGVSKAWGSGYSYVIYVKVDWS